MRKTLGLVVVFAVSGLTTPSMAENFTFGVSVGQSDYSIEYSFPYTDSQGNSSTRDYSEKIDFDYNDISISYIPDDGPTVSVKIGGLSEINDYIPSATQSAAKRDEVSISVSQNFGAKNSNSDLFFGYYQSETTKSEIYEPFYSGYDISENFATSIESDGFFVGFNYSSMTKGNLIWFFRTALQLGWTDFSDSYSFAVRADNNPTVLFSDGTSFNRDLFGTALVLGVGVYLPIVENIGLTFSAETKSYEYDDEEDYHLEGVTTLSEDQTSLIIGLVTNF